METFHLPEHFNLNPNLDFLVYNYESKQEVHKLQVSLQMNTFSFLLKGNKEVFCNNSPITINNHSFLLMKKGHCLMTERLANTDTPYQSILFFVSNKALQNFILENKTVQHATNKAIHAFKYDSFLKNFANGLLEICDLDFKLQQQLLVNKFQELIHYLIATQGDEFLSSFVKSNATTQQQLIHVTEANKHQKLSLNELAFLSNMSLSTFKREFQKHYQQSPSKWFQEQRLENALNLLKNARPSEIYEEIGYETLSNFTQAFKIKYGITPKQHQSKMNF